MERKVSRECNTAARGGRGTKLNKITSNSQLTTGKSTSLDSPLKLKYVYLNPKVLWSIIPFVWLTCKGENYVKDKIYNN